MDKEYSVSQLSSLSSVSVRTLHHYDEIELLRPGRNKNGCRYYTTSDMLKLQQILFFRGLAHMYVDDPRFRKTFEKYDKRLPKFMFEAMTFYCDR